LEQQAETNPKALEINPAELIYDGLMETWCGRDLSNRFTLMEQETIGQRMSAKSVTLSLSL